MTTTTPGRLITLVRRKGLPTCVLLPGAGGGLNPYLRLAGYLGRFYSVYAVRAAGLQPGERPEESIGEMADSAVAALEGHSPALVFGWSLGGTVGWEVCIRLADHGLHPTLVMVDSSPLPRPSVEADDERIRRIILSGLGPRPDERTVAQVDRTFRAQVQALAGHAADRAYTGRVLLLMCPSSEGEGAYPDRKAAVRRWRELAPDLQVGKLDAGHYEVFEPGHLDELTNVVGAFLAGRPC